MQTWLYDEDEKGDLEVAERFGKEQRGEENKDV